MDGASGLRLRMPDFDLAIDERAVRTLAVAAGFRVLFSTYFPAPSSRYLTTVQVVHDLIPLRMPEIYRKMPVFRFYDDHIRRSTLGAAAIIADSEQTRKDIEELLNMPVERVKVIYPGGDHLSEVTPERPPQRLTSLLAGRPFLLAVGSMDPRKNLDNLVTAHRILCERLGSEAVALLLTISDRSLSQLIPGHSVKIQRSTLITTGSVSSAQLAWLYQNALAFVFPSLYEGFGLPLAEALSFGVPIACSNRSCLPEVAGDAALYFDPLEPEAIAATLQRLLEDEQLRNDLSRRGRKRSSQFTWSRTADAFAELLGDL